MRYLAGLLLVAVIAALWMPASAGQGSPSSVAVPRPGPVDLCPVCGMLVSKYPNWVATLVWKDGHAQHFDGAKDLFKFLQALPKYAPGSKIQDVSTMVVTEFYNLQRIEARKSFYVIGSNVMGPMGNELVPFASKADAEEFSNDHRGMRILVYGQVTPEIIAQVDGGEF